MIRRSQAKHGSHQPGHYDLIFSNGRVEHMPTMAAAKKREAQVEMFKHMEAAGTKRK